MSIGIGLAHIMDIVGRYRRDAGTPRYPYQLLNHTLLILYAMIL
jgi:hypothetical protein